MKKIIWSSTIALLLVTGITLFWSCNKENELPTNNKLSNAKAYDAIDLISAEIADFHDYTINAYLNTMHQPGDVFNESYYKKIQKLILNVAQKYKFNYLNKENLNAAVGYIDMGLIETAMSMSENLDFTVLAPYNTNNNFDLNRITKECRSIESMCEKFFYNAETLEQFESEYAGYVNQKLSAIDSQNDYMCVRFFADMYISSFKTWCAACTCGSGGGGAKCSWWDSVKATAQAVWNEVKPVVAADAGGAVAGGIAGAVAAGVGAAPGAAVGALGASAGKCVENLF